MNEERSGGAETTGRVTRCQCSAAALVRVLDARAERETCKKNDHRKVSFPCYRRWRMVRSYCGYCEDDMITPMGEGLPITEDD